LNNETCDCVGENRKLLDRLIIPETPRVGFIFAENDVDIGRRGLGDRSAGLLPADFDWFESSLGGEHIAGGITNPTYLPRRADW
jgi:hypothetical protein